MEIYINNKPIKAEILPVNKPTLDETLETFSFALISNNDSMPYAPCQSVKVITDSNETINLFLVTDSVEIFSLSPARYKHSITCVQNTRRLSKHLVRNSVFSTPSYFQKESYNAVTIALSHRSVEGEGSYAEEGCYGTYDKHRLCKTLNHLSKAVYLSPINNGRNVEKIKNSYLQIDCVGIYTEKATVNNEISSASAWRSDIYQLEDIVALQPVGQLLTNASLILSCQIDNETPYTETITLSQLGITTSTWYLLNTKMKYDRIRELAEQGYKKFEILFPDPVTNLFSGRAYPYQSNFWMSLSFSVKIILETYYYNTYEILDILRERQVKQRDVAGITIHDDYESLYMLPGFAVETELETLMKNTPAPNFIFTQSTLYECLADVFRLFDGIFTLNQYNELGIDYFNNNSNRDVTNTLKKVGQNTSSSEDKYTNGLVAYYQDARTVETFPTEWETSVGDTYATVKTKEMGVPSGNNSFIFETPHNIDSMINFYIRVSNPDSSKFSFETNFQALNLTDYLALGGGVSLQRPLYGFPKLNISHYVVYEDYWTLLDKGGSLYVDNGHLANPTKLMQINTIFFARGTNQVDISYTYDRYWFGQIQFALDNVINCAIWTLLGAYDIPDPATPGDEKMISDFKGTNGNWDQVFAKMQYLTTIDGRTKVESIDRKYDGETLIDQYNGAVDLNRMGLNILGLSLKLGNPTLTVTQKITTWDKRIKQGDIYYYRGKKWIANVVSYTIFGGGFIQATIEFVQNFNALAMRTRLLREKRMSNISSELTVKSEDNIIDYIYYSFDELDQDISSPSRIAVDYLKLAGGLFASLGVSGLSTLYGFEVATFYNPELNYHVYLPMIKYGAGNMVCFEMSFTHPMSAGKQTKIYQDGWFLGANTQYFSQAIYYTDDIGFASTVNIDIFASKSVAMNNDFPKIITGNESGINIDNYKVYKQPNEVFALNYELCFLPIDKELDFIGSKFINDNFFINSLSRTKVSLKFYYGASNFKYSVLDLKGEGNTDANIVSITPELITTTKMVLKITLSKTIDTSNFALCEANGDILFASNRTVNTDTLYITFVTSNKRVDNKVLEDY